ncbi:MAG: hypothetical protein IPM97_00770 [Bdellovibrionaceae bacterium]|nr:hypothetical protein [Pseudobdellovibrionaceae bacterium]
MKKLAESKIVIEESIVQGAINSKYKDILVSPSSMSPDYFVWAYYICEVEKSDLSK